MAEQASETLARLKIMFPLYTFRRCERGRGITAERVTGERAAIQQQQTAKIILLGLLHESLAGRRPVRLPARCRPA